MAGDHTRFRARTIRASTLEVLTSAVRGAPAAGRAAEWEELFDAGIASDAGELRPRWREVLAEAASAPIAFRVHSRTGRAGMYSAISLSPRVGLSITERRRLTVTDTEVVVDAVEDAVEIALFEPKAIWPAVQRVLPPSRLIRAEGGANPREERTVGILRDVPERSALPDGVLADLAGADVEVNLALQVDNGTPTPFVTARHWLEGADDRLLEVRLEDDSLTVVRVPAGSIADEIVWLGVGALDLRSRTQRTAS